MNPLEQDGSPHPLYKSIRFDDFDVTWAGPNPLGPGFCFGSDDGRLRFTDEEGKIVGETNTFSASGEAINGVSIQGTCLAVSTRADLTLRWMDSPGSRQTVDFQVGCHGVFATGSGYLVAPCGRAGILFTKPQHTDEQQVDVWRSSEAALTFYKVVALNDAQGNEILAFSVRQHGVAIMPFSGRIGGTSEIANFNNLDVIDVCALAPNSTAFAAAGRDGTLILFRDALTDKNPFIIKWDAIEGTVYRVLSSRGHIFVLTSKALYMLVYLGSRWLRKEPIQGGTTLILTIPLDAVDANVCGEKRLLVVTADEVLEFDIRAMEEYKPQEANGELRDSVPTVLELNREWRGIPQGTRSLAGVA